MGRLKLGCLFLAVQLHYLSFPVLLWTSEGSEPQEDHLPAFQTGGDGVAEGRTLAPIVQFVRF